MLVRILAGVLLACALLLAASAWSGVPWRKTMVAAPGAIKAVDGAAFEVRLPNRTLFAEVRENGIKLGPRTNGKGDVAEEGEGMFFLRGDTLRFSASDNTDPRTNGRAYRIDYGLRGAGAGAAWLCFAGCALAAGLVVRSRFPVLRNAIAGGRHWAERQRRRISDRFRNFRNAPLQAAGRFAMRNGWLLILAVPSLMLLVCVPPLWRDSDGVWQIAERPGVFTILHWPPLYTFGARIPLWIGTWFDAAFFGGMPPGDDYFARPHFSNPAIYALIFVQHALLCGALALITVVLSKRLICRYGLAVFFSLNAFLYIFAQTIGSESLSNTLTIAFLAAVIVIYGQARFHFSTWLVCGILLVLCILTRHINAVLAAVLPLTFFFEGMLGILRARRGGLSGAHPWLQFSRALAVGIMAILFSSGIVRLICMANGIEYRSRLGYTFQFRLDFLTGLPAADLRDLLLAAGDRAPEASLKEIIRSLDRGLLLDANSGESFVHDKLMANAKQAGIHTRAARLADADRKLNAMAAAFLLPPSRVMRSVIFSDFRKGLQWTPADIAETPIQTTNYLIWALKEDRYKPFRGLIGLQHPITMKNLPPVAAGYIDLWRWCPIWVFPTAALLVCAVLLAREFRSKTARTSLALCASLLLIGSGLMLLNCSITYSLPRFWIPFLIFMEVSVLSAALRTGYGEGHRLMNKS